MYPGPISPLNSSNIPDDNDRNKRKKRKRSDTSDFERRLKAEKSKEEQVKNEIAKVDSTSAGGKEFEERKEQLARHHQRLSAIENEIARALNQAKQPSTSENSSGHKFQEASQELAIKLTKLREEKEKLQNQINELSGQGVGSQRSQEISGTKEDDTLSVQNEIKRFDDVGGASKTPLKGPLDVYADKEKEMNVATEKNKLSGVADTDTANSKTEAETNKTYDNRSVDDKSQGIATSSQQQPDSKEPGQAGQANREAQEPTKAATTTDVEQAGFPASSVNSEQKSSLAGNKQAVGAEDKTVAGAKGTSEETVHSKQAQETDLNVEKGKDKALETKKTVVSGEQVETKEKKTDQASMSQAIAAGAGSMAASSADVEGLKGAYGAQITDLATNYQTEALTSANKESQMSLTFNAPNTPLHNVTVTMTTEALNPFQMNLTFSNLTPRARTFLIENRDMFPKMLGARSITVHQVKMEPDTEIYNRTVAREDEAG